MAENSDISTSGFIFPPENKISALFTELEEIPSSGFNVIVKAKRYGRWWILKGLKEKLREDSLYIELLKKEFYILISMQHPGVVSGIGLEQVKGLGLCIVMEWIDGVSLKKWLNDEHSITERWHVAMQLIDALEYIHSKQVAHRDLKPSNILITRNGQYVKLIDFGLSDTDSYAIFKQPAGTIGYVSPEQASGGKSDVRNDIYSLGCVLDDLHLGVKYKKVIHKCKVDSNKRYSHISEVRKALLSYSSHWNRRIKIITTIGIVISLFFALWINIRNNTNGLISQEQIDSKEEKLNDAITEGKHRMDEIINNINWQEESNIIVYGDIMKTVADGLLMVWENYPQELDSTYSQIDKAQIKEVLTTYYSELYKPIYNKYLQLQEIEQKKMEQTWE